VGGGFHGGGEGAARRAGLGFAHGPVPAVYLGLAPYENVRHFLGLSETNWVNWTEQIRHRCGKELLSRGMFPPRKYFTSGEWSRVNKRVVLPVARW
jgi:hypothetical protein